MTPIGPIEDVTADSSSILTAIGDQWIAIFDMRYHDRSLRYLNWRTRAQQAESGSRRVVPDLDDPGLVRPLCHPLARERNPLDPYFGGPVFRPFQYSRRVGLTTVAHKRRSTLVLEQCGRDKRRILTRRCVHSGCGEQLGAGMVTWITGARAQSGPQQHLYAHAYVIRTRHRRRWHIPPTFIAEVAHTSKAIYVSLGTQSTALDQTWQLLKARVRQR